MSWRRDSASAASKRDRSLETGPGKLYSAASRIPRSGQGIGDRIDGFHRLVELDEVVVHDRARIEVSRLR
jgi:hypothetical protein